MKATCKDCIIRINADHTFSVYEGELTLEGMKKELGIEIAEICDTHHDNILLIDEEGKWRNKNYNEYATILYKYSSTTFGIDDIVGDVLLIPRNTWRKMNDETEELDFWDAETARN